MNFDPSDLWQADTAPTKPNPNWVRWVDITIGCCFLIGAFAGVCAVVVSMGII